MYMYSIFAGETLLGQSDGFISEELASQAATICITSMSNELLKELKCSRDDLSAVVVKKIDSSILDEHFKSQYEIGYEHGQKAVYCKLRSVLPFANDYLKLRLRMDNLDGRFDRVSLRIHKATNREIEAAKRNGTYKEDGYYF